MNKFSVNGSAPGRSSLRLNQKPPQSPLQDLLPQELPGKLLEMSWKLSAWPAVLFVLPEATHFGP